MPKFYITRQFYEVFVVKVVSKEITKIRHCMPGSLRNDSIMCYIAQTSFTNNADMKTILSELN